MHGVWLEEIHADYLLQLNPMYSVRPQLKTFHMYLYMLTSVFSLINKIILTFFILTQVQLGWSGQLAKPSRSMAVSRVCVCVCVGGGGSLYSEGGLVTLEYSVWGGGGGFFPGGQAKGRGPTTQKIKQHP